jgi:hypothetical protein
MTKLLRYLMQFSQRGQALNAKLHIMSHVGEGTSQGRRGMRPAVNEAT